jgi:hypothetical protein
LDDAAAAQDHPWARAGAARDRAILLSAAAPDDEAEAALNDAIARYRDLGLALDEARAIVALGTLRRRPRRFREARTLLRDVILRFDDSARADSPPEPGTRRLGSAAGYRSERRRRVASPPPSSRWSTWWWPGGPTGRSPNGYSSA